MSNDALSLKKLKCIELLANDDMTQKDIAAELDCNPSTISTWKQDRKFMEAVVARSREILKDSLPGVYKTLALKSKAGNDRHMKIYLDHLEKLEEVKASRASISFTWLQPTNTNDNTPTDTNINNTDNNTDGDN